ncbi:hypothetical protein [Radiobacillus deserti]|uniref:hypothetical protein n=1 Tax=Radiobacillus deserti TaxID=2594883 RepID=UPI001E363DCA|nr:hypothetical protein [Radiobacillus deserti]
MFLKIITAIIILCGIAGLYFVIRFGSYSGIIGDDNPFLQKNLAKRREKFNNDDNDEQ